jgi:hypothetical protein
MTSSHTCSNGKHCLLDKHLYFPAHGTIVVSETDV